MQYMYVFAQNMIPFGFMVLLVVRWFIGLVGFFLNASLVYVTIRSKYLRESCNVLIALNAIFSGLFGLSLSLGMGLVLAGRPFLTERECVELQAIPLLCRNLGLNTLFFIALDRIICIIDTSWNHKSIIYWITMICLSCSHAFFILGNCIQMAIDFPDHITLCSTHDDVYYGPATNTLFLVNVSVSVLIFLAHVVLWAAVKWRKNAANGTMTKRLVRSLMAMMAMLVGGFLINNLVQVFYMFIDVTTEMKAYISVFMAWLPAMAYASNALILIGFSTEYRKAYAREFSPLLHLWKHNCNKPLVGSTQTNPTIMGDRRSALVVPMSTIQVKSVATTTRIVEPN